jgi:hypothetical protein
MKGILNDIRIRHQRTLMDKTLFTNPTIKQPGFDMPRQIWVTLNRLRAMEGVHRTQHDAQMEIKYLLNPSYDCILIKISQKTTGYANNHPRYRVTHD